MLHLLIASSTTQSDRRAQKKRELATPEQSESEQNAIEQQQHNIAEQMNDQLSEQNQVDERESDDDLQFL